MENSFGIDAIKKHSKLDAKVSLRRTFFFVGFDSIYIAFFLQSTLLSSLNSFFGSVVFPLKLIGTFFIFVSIFFSKNINPKFFLLSFVMLCLAFMIKFQSTYSLIYLAFVVLGANGIDFEDILKHSLFWGVFLTVVVIATCKAGLIPNLTYSRNGGVRQALGFIYPTDFAAHLSYFAIIGAYLRRHSFGIVDVFACMLIAIFQYKICEARLDTVIVLATTVVFILTVVKNNSDNGDELFSQTTRSILTKIAYVSVPVMFFATFYLSELYIRGNSFAISLDNLLSFRIRLIAQAMNTYQFRMLGQYIPMNGFGGLSGYTLNRSIYGYFMIDSSYAQIALQFGVLSMIVIILLLWRVYYVAKLNKNIYLLIITTLALIHSFVAQFLLNPSYNVILLAAFASFVKFDADRKEKRIRATGIDQKETL